MKTRNNIQKTVNSHLMRVVIGGFAVFFCTAFFSLATAAGDLKQLASTNANNVIATSAMSGTVDNQFETSMNISAYDASEFAAEDLAMETENWLENNAETNFASIENHLSIQAEGYSATDFFEPELASETENYLNSYQEDAETAITLPVEVYHSEDFVEADMELEIQNELNYSSETVNAGFESEIEQQILNLTGNSNYDAQVFVNADMTQETNSWMTCNN